MASKLRIVNVPVAGSGGVDILATCPVRRYVIRESKFFADGSANAALQGITIQDKTALNMVPAGVAGPKISVAATDPPFKRPDADDSTIHESKGITLANGPSAPNLGLPAGAAQPLCNVVSNTATATAVLVEEIY